MLQGGEANESCDDDLDDGRDTSEQPVYSPDHYRDQTTSDSSPEKSQSFLTVVVQMIVKNRLSSPFVYRTHA